jgi:hypothetical protein
MASEDDHTAGTAIAAFALAQAAIWTAIDGDPERRARAIAHITASIGLNRASGVGRGNLLAADKLEFFLRLVQAGGPKLQ